jgi:hypothetical protein
MKTPYCHGIPCAVALLLLTAVSAVRAQQPPHDHSHAGASTPPAATGAPAKSTAPGKGMMMDMSKGMPGCAALMQMQQQMEADRKADDARLNDLTTKMNEATGDQKTAAMAAVINELVAQRVRARDAAAKMQGQMMQNMMGHMQHGGSASVMQCPMMAAMAAGGHADSASGAATGGAPAAGGKHAQHQP